MKHCGGNVILLMSSIVFSMILEDAFMAVSYKRLWKLLIDKDMKKKDLEELANISHYTINKLNRGDNITTDIIQKICLSLKCTPDEIMEIIPDEQIKG